ncbi:hypothetical protein ZIOFF_046373 [Zingiber officinale]|uniref:Trehalose-phosphatase n=1 Tax=Zingiber officinale TaxID=94328 RepID=A0A8J5KW57_ZINOF|nr:hypothetical protein ZIOFF_046373 [Zingiber officinale]
MDIFKGINLKLLAFEHMLKIHHKWQGRAVLVQIANPARAQGKDLKEIQDEIQESCQRINRTFGHEGYSPVVLIERSMSAVEKVAYYSIAECVVVTAVRDGMNLTPYEYIVCRQGIFDSADSVAKSPAKSMLVVSEFIGCSPSLSALAVRFGSIQKELRHEKHYRYVSTHNVAYWSKSFMQGLERTCKDHFSRNCWGSGLGFGFRVVAVDPNFRKLHADGIASAYTKAKSRAILLDYDGTLVPQTSINKKPSREVIRIVSTLCEDKQNVVFIVSGRGRQSLDEWFLPCEKLDIAAEHGYFIRDADPDFGSAQAKEMLDHLESVLANEPVSVKSGKFIVEVKPQGVSKGLVAEKILSSLSEKGRPADFVLCIGDDRSNEDMFENIAGPVAEKLIAPDASIFGCTVGQKPSQARFFLDDTNDVLNTLTALADASEQFVSPENITDSLLSDQV